MGVIYQRASDLDRPLKNGQVKNGYLAYNDLLSPYHVAQFLGIKLRHRVLQKVF